MYIANTYIGKAYTPGEVISDELPADTLDWLIKSGAIREVVPDIAHAAEAGNADNEKDDPLESVRQNYYNQLHGLGYGPDGNGLAREDVEDEPDHESTPEATDEAAEAEDEAESVDEIDEDAEAPEIDIMDGIVASTPAKEEKPARAVRKPANRTNERSKAR